MTPTRTLSSTPDGALAKADVRLRLDGQIVHVRIAHSRRSSQNAQRT
jgi:hypothetical protein